MIGIELVRDRTTREAFDWTLAVGRASAGGRASWA